MAESIDANGNEPVLAVKITKLIWILVFVIAFLAYELIQFEDHVDKIVTDRIQDMANKIDHEMDDVSDLYEASLNEIIKGSCSDAMRVFKASHVCQRR